MARVVRSSVGHWGGKKLSISERERRSFFNCLCPPMFTSSATCFWECTRWSGNAPPLCCSLKTKNGNRRKNPFITWYSAIHRPKTGEIKAPACSRNKEGFIDHAASRQAHSGHAYLCAFSFLFFPKHFSQEKNFFFLFKERKNQTEWIHMV